MTAPSIDPAVPAFVRPDLESNAAGVRLAMKAADQLRGHFDGVWWPRSAEPLDEFPTLIRAVAHHVTGKVTRLAYDLNAWLPVPRTRKIILDGNVIRLEGFGVGLTHTLMISNHEHTRTRLLVIPPESSPDEARRIVSAALEDQPEATAPVLLDLISRRPADTQTLDTVGRSTL